jgi:hypothetical protein
VRGGLKIIGNKRLNLRGSRIRMLISMVVGPKCEGSDRDIGSRWESVLREKIERLDWGINSLWTSVANEAKIEDLGRDIVVLWDSLDSLPTWNGVEKVDSLLGSVKTLLLFQCKSWRAVGCQPTEASPEVFHEYWLSRYLLLLRTAQRQGVHHRRLSYAQRLASRYVMQACRVLEAELRKKINAPLFRLLRSARSLKVRLLRAFARVYRFRNQIILQRRYYLTHGSHPTENTICPEGWSSLRPGGFVPAFFN